MIETTWTIAYRKRTANRFLRVASWSGSWAQAHALAGLFAEANPTLEVFYTPTAESDVNGPAEDAGNILTDSGRRVRVVDTDDPVAAELIERIPAPEVARERWQAGERIANPTQEAAHAEALALCASIPVDGRPDHVTVLLAEAELATDAVENLRLVKQAHARYVRHAEALRDSISRASLALRHAGGLGRLDTSSPLAQSLIAEDHAEAVAIEQVRAWMTRHALLAGPGTFTAERALAARDADHAEALDMALGSLLA